MILRSKSLKGQRKAESSAVVLGILLVFVAAVLLYWFSISRPSTPQQPASLSFNFNFPNSLPANSNVVLNVGISNQGGDATSILVTVTSPAFGGSSLQFDLASGKSTTVSLTLSAKNVQLGRYQGIVQAQYTDVTGRQATAPIAVSTYVLQPVTVTGIGWLVDLFHLGGKSTIGATDSTDLHFQVQSLGSFPIAGLKVFVSTNVTAHGMTFSPSNIVVGDLGPQGTSAQLSMTISTSNTPPGRYAIFLTIISNDNFQLYKTNVWLTVTA